MKIWYLWKTSTLPWTINLCENFCELNDLSSLIDKTTCYKNFDKPTFNTYKKHSYFQHSNVFETGLSDFHLLTVTEFKMGFQKLKPQVITYRIIDFRRT